MAYEIHANDDLVVRIAENPHDIQFSWDDVPANRRWLYALPHVEQHSQRWFDVKKDHVSGSELGAILVEGFPYKTFDDYCKQKAGLLPPEETNDAMKHGTAHESAAAQLYCLEEGDFTTELGFVEDEEYAFLGVSPDRVAVLGDRLIEIKSPYYRQITDERRPPPEVEFLAREVMTAGGRHNYRAIVNLRPEHAGMMDKILHYHMQCQLQCRVMKYTEKPLHFVQAGFSPNRHYLESPTLSVIEVPYDDTWLATHIDKLRKTWDTVLRYRQIAKEKPLWKLEHGAAHTKRHLRVGVTRTNKRQKFADIIRR